MFYRKTNKTAKTETSFNQNLTKQSFWLCSITLFPSIKKTSASLISLRNLFLQLFTYMAKWESNKIMWNDKAEPVFFSDRGKRPHGVLLGFEAGKRNLAHDFAELGSRGSREERPSWMKEPLTWGSRPPPAVAHRAASWERKSWLTASGLEAVSWIYSRAGESASAGNLSSEGAGRPRPSL